MSRWLLLAHQLPARSSNARVKTWRRLQDVGAVPVRNSVYALPNTDACREDFEWIRNEIVALGGEATLFAAVALEPGGDADLEAAFRRARDADYVALAREAKAAARDTASGSLPRSVRTLAERLDAIRRIDFFHAPAGDAAADAIDALERRVSRASRQQERNGMQTAPTEFVNRRWVTRPRPGVDRMASAWLIRRYVDPNARFAFVAQPGDNDVPFDMYTGEFSHQGDRCTYEVLAQRFEITDPAATRIAHIVHDLDMKENRYEAPEASAIGRMIDGLRQLHADDQTLLDQGIAMFEALARSFASGTAAPRKHKPSGTRKRGKRQ